jgi:cell division protein FtsQ
VSEGGRLRALADRVAARLPGRRAARVAGALGALSLTAAAPWWGPAALSELRYFRVRRVEVVGATYLEPREVARRLAVDTTQSVWLDLDALERRVAALPQVKEARVERKLPGTLVVRVAEHLPVALVPSREGLTPYDARGVALPIDPSRADVDVPVVETRDTAAFRLLEELRGRDPALFARVSELRRSARGAELVLVMPPFIVRAAADLTAGRLADILPVESDLARRQARIAELDLRFRDQVVARLQ